jgi:hypothetical protein
MIKELRDVTNKRKNKKEKNIWFTKYQEYLNYSNNTTNIYMFLKFLYIDKINIVLTENN